MMHFKKHIAFVFIFTLLLPLGIQVAHAFENHEHTICKSTTEKHFHKKDYDCSDVHQILETYFNVNTVDFSTELTSFYKNNYNKQPQKIRGVFLSKKSSRAPPVKL